mmetsp:Transcript_34720/g.87292  ORF Transcript_34720/g.87292 Transcript_34720/m.87292 type:complete len:148 (+) Transcript_34720:140-583(+)
MLDERARAAQVLAQARSAHFDGLYFGGVCFKYQPHCSSSSSSSSSSSATERSYEECARAAHRYMHVVTTSGVATGQQIDMDKLRTMRSAVGETGVLAVASGVTVENLPEQLPYLDCVLVATGVSDSFHELNTERIAALVEVAHTRGS